MDAMKSMTSDLNVPGLDEAISKMAESDPDKEG
jgi:hypothetical protein